MTQTAQLLGQFTCRKGCGRMITHLGGLARHENACVVSIDDLLNRAGISANTEGCWIWPGVPEGGRGRVTWTRPWTGKTAHDYVYRVAYYLMHNDMDHSLLVCHTCDDGRCFNPDCLFQGTPSDNLQDMIKKGRGYLQRRSDDERRAAGIAGGTAVQAALRPEERSAKARAAAVTRWSNRQDVQLTER